MAMAKFEAKILIFLCATAMLWKGGASVDTSFYIWNGVQQELTFGEYGDIDPADQPEFVIDAPQGLQMELKVGSASGCDITIDVTVQYFLFQAGTTDSDPVFAIYVYSDGMYGPYDPQGTSANPVNRWPVECSALTDA